jgi:hypothetical protein
MSDELVAEAATYTTQNKHKRRTERIELAILEIKGLQAYSLDTMATWICLITYNATIFCCSLRRKELQLM